MNSGLFDLTGKKALVTGGNSGLGLAFARGLAGAGADVAIWGRREEKNREAVQALREFGTRITAQAVDVANEEEVRQAMREACEEFGRLDCVVVNAGFASRTNSVLDLDSSLYHDLLAVNQHGAFYTIREAARHMAERSEAGRPGGSIIVCGSLSIVSGTPGMSHYAAAKGALNAIVKTLAVELGPHQVRVNMICPGLVATEMTQADPAVWQQLDALFSSQTPLGRTGVPEEFEAIVVYLASDGSRYHTGDTIIIDGGRSLI